VELLDRVNDVLVNEKIPAVDARVLMWRMNVVVRQAGREQAKFAQHGPRKKPPYDPVRDI